MLSYTFIYSHSQVSDSGPKGHLVLTHFQEDDNFRNLKEIFYTINRYVNISSGSQHSNITISFSALY